jgi:hypothetical protein
VNPYLPTPLPIRLLSLLLRSLAAILCSSLLIAACATRPAAAENILFLPTAAQMMIGEEKINLSQVSPRDSSQGNLTLYEAYYGVAQSIEISVLKTSRTGADKSQSFNVSYFLSPETSEDWASAIGASNVGGDKYLGTDNPSYYLAFYRTHSTTTSSPSRQYAPTYRYHVGYGTNAHNGFFGGVQVITNPKMWFGAFNYSGRPIYVIDYALTGVSRAQLSLRAGYLWGDPWIGFSYGGVPGQ